MPTPHDVKIARGTPGVPRPRGRPLTSKNNVGIGATDIDLEDIQGILVADLRQLPEATYLLLRIDAERSAVEWVRWVSAQTWYARRTPTTVALNVAFTHDGLRKLGLEERALAEFPEAFRPDSELSARRAHRLGDEGESAPTAWRWGNDRNPVDALVMLYGVDPAALDALIAEHVTRAEAAGIEVVERLRAAPFRDPFKEPFGFADGISQPPIDRIHAGADGERPVATGEFLLGHPNEIGVYPISPSVAPEGADELEPTATDSRRNFGRNGTYLVFRQLEQDVLAFWRAAEAQAKSASASGPITKWGAKMIGRWPSGAPLVLCPEDDDPNLGGRNDFNYRMLDDDRGLRCPQGSHIRRTNPRDSLPRTDGYRSLAVVRQHRIIRRSRAYGEPLAGWPDPEGMVRNADPSTERGLCFVCLNADLSQQFEFIQERWMNDPTFVCAKSGERDPLVGNPAPDASLTIPADPVAVTIGGSEAPLSRFVTVRGSAYFFLPSRRALAYLARNGRRSERATDPRPDADAARVS